MKNEDLVPIMDGTLFAPFYIFIKGVSTYSDLEILRWLGLKELKLETSGTYDEEKYFYVTEDKNWTHIMDSWDYNLWHRGKVRKSLEALSSKYDIFYFSVGDSDKSFDFTYYKQGKLIRKYVVSDPEWKGGVIIEDVGDSLPGEKMAFEESDELNRMYLLSKSIGIDLQHNAKDVRVYSYKNE